MARNAKRDQREAERRRKQLTQAGFDLFSENGIYSVSLQNVADEAHVGIATLYNYYKTKENLLAAVSAYIWDDVLKSMYENNDMDAVNEFNAYEIVEFYCDRIINLYITRKNVLRFSSDYKTYMNRVEFENDVIAEQLQVLSPINDIFHIKYEAAKKDKSIRTDIPEEEMIRTISLTMLGMAERYAQGLVWEKQDDNIYQKELEHLRDMILIWVKG